MLPKCPVIKHSRWRWQKRYLSKRQIILNITEEGLLWEEIWRHVSLSHSGRCVRACVRVCVWRSSWLEQCVERLQKHWPRLYVNVARPYKNHAMFHTTEQRRRSARRSRREMNSTRQTRYKTSCRTIHSPYRVRRLLFVCIGTGSVRDEVCRAWWLFGRLEMFHPEEWCSQTDKAVHKSFRFYQWRDVWPWTQIPRLRGSHPLQNCLVQIFHGALPRIRNAPVPKWPQRPLILASFLPFLSVKAHQSAPRPTTYLRFKIHSYPIIRSHISLCNW